jgi:hypothetical protein
MDKEKIKDRIYWHELNKNGLRHVSGGDVIVKNIKIQKDKVIAGR